MVIHELINVHHNACVKISFIVRIFKPKILTITGLQERNLQVIFFLILGSFFIYLQTESEISRNRHTLPFRYFSSLYKFLLVFGLSSRFFLFPLFLPKIIGFSKTALTFLGHLTWFLYFRMGTVNLHLKMGIRQIYKYKYSCESNKIAKKMKFDTSTWSYHMVSLSSDCER
jgi:hypothetical protein